MVDIGCDHSTSKALHDKLWKVYAKHREILEKSNVKKLAGPYDRPSGARVIFDVPKDEELLSSPEPSRKRFDKLCDFVYELLETRANHNKEKPSSEYESVTVKVTFPSAPSMPKEIVQLEKRLEKRQTQEKS